MVGQYLIAPPIYFREPGGNHPSPFKSQIKATYPREQGTEGQRHGLSFLSCSDHCPLTLAAAQHSSGAPRTQAAITMDQRQMSFIGLALPITLLLHGVHRQT